MYLVCTNNINIHVSVWLLKAGEMLHIDVFVTSKMLDTYHTFACICKQTEYAVRTEHIYPLTNTLIQQQGEINVILLKNLYATIPLTRKSR